MSTSDYALVALSIEQTNLRMSVALFDNAVDAALEGHGAGSDARRSLLCEFEALHKSCHWRKVELYLMQAMQGAGQESDSLLAELVALDRLCASLYLSVRENARAVAGRLLQPEFLKAQFKLYCKTQLLRLEKEESELFPLASRILPKASWCSLAERFLEHDMACLEEQQQEPQQDLVGPDVRPLVNPFEQDAAAHC